MERKLRFKSRKSKKRERNKSNRSKRGFSKNSKNSSRNFSEIRKPLKLIFEENKNKFSQNLEDLNNLDYLKLQNKMRAFSNKIAFGKKESSNQGISALRSMGDAKKPSPRRREKSLTSAECIKHLKQEIESIRSGKNQNIKSKQMIKIKKERKKKKRKSRNKSRSKSRTKSYFETVKNG